MFEYKSKQYRVVAQLNILIVLTDFKLMIIKESYILHGR